MTLPEDLPYDVPVDPTFPDEPLETGDDDGDDEDAEDLDEGRGNPTGVRQAEKNREMDPPA